MLPFDRYPSGGRQLLGTPGSGDGTARHGYGLPVLGACGTQCVYCERELGDSYEDWLSLSVDHVIPASPKRTTWAAMRTLWLHDLANLVTCCRACNEFHNGYKVTAQLPGSLSEFFVLRDRVFTDKLAIAQRAHAREIAFYADKPWR